MMLFQDSMCPHNGAGIYAIINRCNLKIYVGSAVSLAARKRVHRWQVNRGIHHNEYLQRAILKSPDEFEFSVIEYVEDRAKLINREQFWINFYQSYNPDCGYNICPRAESRLGAKGKPQSEDVRKRRSETLKRGYAEGRILKSRLGTKLTLEHRLAISSANKGKQFTLGRVMPKEERELRSKMFKGRVFTEEWKQKISDAKKGTRPMPHVIEASRIARLGKPACNRRAVLQIKHDTGEIIQRFDSIAMAAKHHGVHKAAIDLCLSGKTKSSCGAKWAYADKS